MKIISMREDPRFFDRVPTSRRDFLLRAGGAGLALLSLPHWKYPAEDDDEAIVRRVFAWAKERGLASMPVGEIVAAIGESFIGTPYVAHSLETEGTEHLVVNLRGFDCLTFVENSLALARCVRSGTTTFAQFRTQLTHIRYSSGIINGYPSRLHYFTDWMADNARKKVIRDITVEAGGTEYRKAITFMSTHRASYRQLADDAALKKIVEAETRLSSEPLYRVTKEQLPASQGKLQSGDIIGTVTSMEGMDIAHTGMVLLTGGTPRFLHAPLSGAKVMLSTGDLASSVQGIRSNTGVVMARPLEPAA
jgi:cell wall-associated NlpC family hydrolase